MKPTTVFYKNLKAYKDGFRLINNQGGARSSKTRGLIQLNDFIAANSSKHKKISIVSQTFPHLTQGAIYEYKKHQMENSVIRQSNKAEHEYYVNKSIINYFSCDDPTKAIGPGRDILYINEVNNGIPWEVFTELRSRTGECIFTDWNPSCEFWMHDQKLFDDPRTITIRSTWLDNLENLTKAQIQDFLDAKKKSKTSDFWNYWWKVYGLGEDGVLLEERIMPFLKRASKVPDDAVMIPCGLDYGFFPDPTAFVQLWIRRKPIRDELYIKEIVYDQRLSINSNTPSGGNLTDLLKTRGINTKLKTIAECADPRANSELVAAGYNIEAVVKMAVETSIRLFHDYDIYVLDGSDNAYKELENYKYDRDKQGRIIGVPKKGQADHVIDAVRYVLSSRNSRWSVK